MRPEIAKYLHDVRQACRLIESFLEGKTFNDYEVDALLRAGVERQMIVIGEALAQAARVEPTLGQAIDALPQIIAFRNVLVHGYAVVKHDTVWGTLENELGVLRQQVETLLSVADAG